MKTIFLSFIMAVLGFASAMGQSLVEKAATEYNNDKYPEALELYLQAAKAEGTSSDLYYNIGNTYYRMGDLGHAVLYYERALVMDPSNDDAATNLEFVNSKIQTRISEEKSFVVQVIDTVVESQTSNSWATIAAISFVLLVAAILLYAFSSVIALRKVGFFGGGILIVVIILSLMCAVSVKSRVEAHDKAVVVSPSVTLSTVPRTPKDKTEEAFILTSGNKVTIVDSVENKTGEAVQVWVEVKADDTHRAWLKKEHLERI